MLTHTKAALQKIVGDFIKIGQAFEIIVFILSAGYFSFALGVGIGYVWANALALAIVVAINVLRLVVRYTINNKRIKKISARVYRYGRIFVQTLSLAIMLYGIYTAAVSVNGISIILATLMTILWILQVLIEIVSVVLENKLEYFMAELHKDVDPVYEKYILPIIDAKDKIAEAIEVATPKIVETRERIKLPFLNVVDKLRRKKELKDLVSAEKEQLYLVASDVDEESNKNNK